MKKKSKIRISCLLSTDVGTQVNWIYHSQTKHIAEDGEESRTKFLDSLRSKISLLKLKFHEKKKKLSIKLSFNFFENHHKKYYYMNAVIL